MVSASSLETFSLIGLGAPSTRSFASFKPRLVTSRTALITLILFAPALVRTTVNSVFSSAGAAAAAPPPAAPATITGAAAAADTPRRSSNFFTSSAASRSDKPTICSSNCCKSAIFILQFEFVIRCVLRFRYRQDLCSKPASGCHAIPALLEPAPVETEPSAVAPDSRNRRSMSHKTDNGNLWTSFHQPELVKELGAKPRDQE